ncbi:MAG: hypothetical protein AB7U81_01885 [Thiohalomonadaceae bacterium]
MFQENDAYDEAAREAVELGNQLLERDKDALWDVADGLLAGAIHFWLYARQPCGDPRCEDCAPISTAEQRLAELLQLTRELAEDSDYYHSPNDANVGRA